MRPVGDGLHRLPATVADLDLDAAQAVLDVQPAARLPASPTPLPVRPRRGQPVGVEVGAAVVRRAPSRDVEGAPPVRERLEQERRKLDEMRAEFDSYVRELRRAKDQDEFDRFMRERNNVKRNDNNGGPVTEFQTP